ncbi:MAG: DUF2892 domain-containing protein [Burkholderiales bacterium]
MPTENIIRIFAGTMILVSLALGAPASPLFHNANWLWLTVFVGANLFQFGFTGFCPLNIILRKLGVKNSVEIAMEKAQVRPQR